MVTVSEGPLEKLAAYALRYVKPGQTLGLGTGRAASAFIRALGASRIPVRGVPTSLASHELAHECGIELVSLNDVERLDADFDGADEVDPDLNLIKGYGGALVREKVVASASRKVFILVGPEKLVPQLGAHRRLPVEVVRFAEPYVRRRLAKLGLKGRDRVDGDGNAFLSDNGNLIIDCAVSKIRDASHLEDEILSIPGVVGTGLFVDIADTVLVTPTEDSPVRVIKRKS